MNALETLAAKECKDCKGDVPPLAGAELREMTGQLGHGWKAVDGHHLEKQFKFKDFKQALAFTNKVGAIAEAQDHHPDILLSWGKVGVTVWTHTANGLTESDFVLAAKVESIPQAG